MQAGIVAPIRPDKLMRIAGAWARWGTSPALGSLANAINYPDEVSIVDELGTLTFSETHGRKSRVPRTRSPLTRNRSR